MTDLSRRSFLRGIAAGLAPAIIRTPGLLMPIKALTVGLPAIAQYEWLVRVNFVPQAATGFLMPDGSNSWKGVHTWTPERLPMDGAV